MVQLRAGHPHRLCGFEPTSNSIALSRALGDACEQGWQLGRRPHAFCGAAQLHSSLARLVAAADQHRLPLPLAAFRLSAGAAELGLTYEPDALSITLPDPALASLDWPGTSSSSSMSSVDAEALEEAGSRPRRAARHVLVAASDGLWDMLSNEEAVGIALRWGNRLAGAAHLAGVQADGLAAFAWMPPPSALLHLTSGASPPDPGCPALPPLQLPLPRCGCRGAHADRVPPLGGCV